MVILPERYVRTVSSVGKRKGMGGVKGSDFKVLRDTDGTSSENTNSSVALEK